MKKTILILLALLVTLPVALARAEAPVTLLISGDNDHSAIDISLSADGRDYVIVSSSPLEVGGEICTHPEEIPTQLVCKATAIAGFEVNAGGGSDFVFIAANIPVPVTIRGGPGADRLTGGSAADKIIGGSDSDKLIGHRGDDVLLGGPGADKLLGGAGDDYLRGGPDKDQVSGGPGNNDVLQ